TGDTLVIRSEGVVGLAWTWPVAVTEAHGALHAATCALEDLDSDGKAVFTAEQIELARSHAARMKAPRTVADAAKELANARPATADEVARATRARAAANTDNVVKLPRATKGINLEPRSADTIKACRAGTCQ